MNTKCNNESLTKSELLKIYSTDSKKVNRCIELYCDKQKFPYREEPER